MRGYSLLDYNKITKPILFKTDVAYIDVFIFLFSVFPIIFDKFLKFFTTVLPILIAQ